MAMGVQLGGSHASGAREAQPACACAQALIRRFTSDRMHLLPSKRAAQVLGAEAYKEELRQQIEEKKRRKVSLQTHA